jgi:23S rRNA (cytosine1962-C5)-methyltransferase
MIPQEKAAMFRNRLGKVFRHLSRQARRQSISCYRIYDHDLPEFPFCIEQYGQWLYVAEYRRHHGMDEETHAQWLDDCRDIISGITGVDRDHMVLRTRRRKPGRRDQYQKLDEAQQFLVVEEQGLQFRINLSDYLDTGLFLDHRITRSRVRAEAAGKKVLNLFCYTGSFSVYAAAGGASEIWSVDLSKTYLQWAVENMQLNGLYDPARHRYLHEDVMQYLDGIPAQFFDLVIMDPPTFSNSKRMQDFLDIQRDHPRLINQALRGMRPGGMLYFSTNFSRFQLQASHIAGAEIKDITRATTPFDFEGRLKRYCFLIRKPGA